MCNIEFTIQNNKGQPVHITAEIGENNLLYRCGKPIYCNCNDTLTPYEWNGREVYCPNCGKTSEQVRLLDKESEIYLEYIGTDYNTMQDLYRLSDTIPYSTWNIVADLFMKLSSDDVDLGYVRYYIGWVTSNPEAVEERLNIPEDLRVVNRPKEITDQQKSTDYTLGEDYYFDIVDKLHEVFSVVETPYGEYDLLFFNGKKVDNPLFPPNVYGTGEFWYYWPPRTDGIGGEIWYVRQNFRPGDNLNRNNIKINGELKAIGKRISYDEDVVELIQKLETIK